MKPSKPKTLGPALATFRGQPVSWRGLLKILIPGGMIVAAPLLYGIWRARYASQHYGPAAAQSWGLPWYIIAAAILIPVLGMVSLFIRRSQRAVVIFKNGLGIQINRHQKLALRWHEIGGITSQTVETRFLGILLKNRCRLIIHPRTGKAILIHPALPRQEELAARIKARVYPRLLPELRNAFKAGRDLYFGEVVLNPQGIQLRGQKIPWKQVAIINARQGFLVVELKNHIVRKISVEKIPNIELLLQIIQEGVDA